MTICMPKANTAPISVRLTLFGTLTGLDPRSLGAAEHAASDLGITPEVAAALQGVAAATLGFSLNAHYRTAPGQVTEPRAASPDCSRPPDRSASRIPISPTPTPVTSDPADARPRSARSRPPCTPIPPVTGPAVSINWQFAVDNAALASSSLPAKPASSIFFVTLSDANGGLAQRDIAVTLNGSYNDAPVASNDTADAQVAGLSVAAPRRARQRYRSGGRHALVVSAVNGVAANVGNATAGTYGHLSLFSDGHYGYVADNSAALASAPTGKPSA